MIEFFDGTNAQSKIASLISNADRIRIAVAYWGKDAARNLRLKDLKRRDVKIVCDLDNGGSNPSEIKEIQRTFGKQNVLSCPWLHAKAWITDKCVILGSSNASANGIGWEGAETSGLIEANIITDDKNIVSAVHKWFEQCVMRGARQINKDDFDRAKKAWKERRTRRPWPSGPLSKALRSSDAVVDRNIEVWIWKQQDLTKRAGKKIDAARKERKNNRIDGYELGRESKRSPQAGTVIVEFDYDDEDNKFKFIEATRILQDNPIRKFGNKRVALCLPAPEVTKAVRSNLTKWESGANSAVPRSNKSWFGSLHDFCGYLSKQSATRTAIAARQRG